MKPFGAAHTALVVRDTLMVMVGALPPPCFKLAPGDEPARLLADKVEQVRRDAFALGTSLAELADLAPAFGDIAGLIVAAGYDSRPDASADVVMRGWLARRRLTEAVLLADDALKLFVVIESVEGGPR